MYLSIYSYGLGCKLLLQGFLVGIYTAYFVEGEGREKEIGARGRNIR